MKTDWNPINTLAKASTMSFGGYGGQERTWGWNATFCEGGRGFTSDSEAKAASKEAVDQHLRFVQAVFADHTITIERGDKPYPSSTSYDYRVMIDGEHRATFRPSGFARGYHLRDLGDEGIKFSTYENHGTVAEKKDHFLEIVAVAIVRVATTPVLRESGAADGGVARKLRPSRIVRPPRRPGPPSGTAGSTAARPSAPTRSRA